MIVALITLCGGTLADAKLERYLRRMNADVNMPMDKTEATLQKMIKQGYLIRIKENVGGEETIDWMVGPRGKLEVGNKGVKGLIMDVYGDSAPEDLADRVNSSLGLDVPREEQEEQPADARAAETAPRGRGRPPGRRRQADDGPDD
jgi:melanoma-associated antigen